MAGRKRVLTKAAQRRNKEIKKRQDEVNRKALAIATKTAGAKREQFITFIEYELYTVTSCNQGTQEKRGTYLSRMAIKATEIDNSTWENLSEPAQQWVSDSILAIQNKTTLPLMPGESQEDRDSDRIIQTGPGKKPRGQIVRVIKETMLHNPNITRIELEKECTKRGVEPSKTTLNTYYSDMRGTISVMREMKVFKE